jgi:hypothetical protein
MAALRHIQYSAVERQLAAQARAIANARNVLYHGTRYTQSILDSGVLFRAHIGEQKVCLTRSAEVAAYWAMLRRDDDEGRGSIFIFNRRSLERRYKIIANPKPYWLTRVTFHDEAEEEIWDDVMNVHIHLIDLTFGPKNGRLPNINKPIARRVRSLPAKNKGSSPLHPLDGLNSLVTVGDHIFWH